MVIGVDEGGECWAWWIDASRDPEHLETKTLTGVDRGQVIYSAGGRGNT